MSAAAEQQGPPPGAAADWTVDQRWSSYTPDEHAVWVTLYERQTRLLKDRACAQFLNGLEALDLHGDGIPDFEAISDKLEALTGWRVVAVEGLVPDDVFFDHLANRRFPAGRFIRGRHQLDYLQEPDVFHDVFGHVPMLTDPTFADYMQAYGEGGQRALGLGQLHHLARLYWYTVEFGLMRSDDGDLRIYGAGIVSSRTESVYALEHAAPHRIGFDLERVMRTPYRIDDLQAVYFVIPSLQTLLDVTQRDFAGLYTQLRTLPDIPIEAILPTDTVVSVG
jgi:phenylalanine-4-hydroxylase